MPRKKSPIDAHVGAKLKARRAEIEMRQERLAALLGVTFQQIQKYENGNNRIAASRLAEASQVLDVPIAYFFQDLPDQPAAMSSASDLDEILAFVGNAEGLELNRLFQKISDPEKRRVIVTLCQMMS